jgi:hypothetical protein
MKRTILALALAFGALPAYGQTAVGPAGPSHLLVLSDTIATTRQSTNDAVLKVLRADMTAPLTITHAGDVKLRGATVDFDSRLWNRAGEFLGFVEIKVGGQRVMMPVFMPPVDLPNHAPVAVPKAAAGDAQGE